MCSLLVEGPRNKSGSTLRHEGWVPGHGGAEQGLHWGHFRSAAVQTVLAHKPKMCSFLEWRDLKIVYKRYASLYFCCYFGSVCELYIIFNFKKAYLTLDEFLLGGEVQETSKKNVLKHDYWSGLLQSLLARLLLAAHAPGRWYVMT
uniref:AP complex mu/sigma subunit domain-containing protein n=1 Tax=Serinus canaria TaxID=9135 RepID=A0A8C9NBI7_SERCA